MVMAGVNSWVDLHATHEGQKIADRALCTWVSSIKGGTKILLEDAINNTRDTWINQNTWVGRLTVNFKLATGNTLTQAKAASLFDYKQVGHDRKRTWISKDDCFYE